MNTRRFHEKLAHALTGLSRRDFLQRAGVLEHAPRGPSDSGAALVPMEPNFQLPNEFLRTMVPNDVEGLFSEHGYATAWTVKLDQLIALLDELEFEGHGPEAEECDAAVLGALLRRRYGG